MALVRAYELAARRLRAVTPQAVPQERYAAREDARAVRAALAKLERPRYDEVVEPVDPFLMDKVVLVFENGPPLEVDIPPLELAPARPIIFAPPESEERRDLMDKREKARLRELMIAIRQADARGMSVELSDEDVNLLDQHPAYRGRMKLHAINGPTLDRDGRRVLDAGGFEPKISEEEASHAAFRAFIAAASEPPRPLLPPDGKDAPAPAPAAPPMSRMHIPPIPDEQMRAFGDYGPREAWLVTRYENGRRVATAFVGTVSALRRNFPDLDERERMRAADVLGVPSWEWQHDEHGNRILVDLGYQLPDAPLRVRKLGMAP